MQDEDIDLSDMPELTEEALKRAKPFRHSFVNVGSNMMQLRPRLWLPIMGMVAVQLIN